MTKHPETVHPETVPDAQGQEQVRKRPRRRGENALTLGVAVLATAVSAQGMWRFFGSEELAFSPALRVATFSVLELAMFASAMRARRNVLEFGRAGVDGIAVWAITSLSAVLSAMHTTSWPDRVFRLAIPLVAAWLWERGMSIERRRTGGRRIHWRLTPERLLVRRGVAEPTDRTASEVDAHRRLTRLARRAKKVRTLQALGARPRRIRRAVARLDRAMEQAVEYAGLASDPARQQALLAQLGALYNAAGLAEVAAVAPWESAPAIAPAADGTPALTAPAVPAPDAPAVRTDAPHGGERAVRMNRADEPADPQDVPHGADKPAPHVRTDTPHETPQEGPQEVPQQPAPRGPQREVRNQARADNPHPVRTDRSRKTVRTHARTTSPQDLQPVDRDALVTEVAEALLAAAEAGEKYRPDWDDLQARSGRKKRWCEDVWADAKRLALSIKPDAINQKHAGEAADNGADAQSRRNTPHEDAPHAVDGADESRTDVPHGAEKSASADDTAADESASADDADAPQNGPHAADGADTPQTRTDDVPHGADDGADERELVAVGGGR